MPQAETKSPTDIIAEAFAASEAAAAAQFKADGERDCGSCGGYILAVDGRGKVGKALVANGQGRKSFAGAGVIVRFPRGEFPSRHMEIDESAGRAAKAVFERHGVKITEARSYVD